MVLGCVLCREPLLWTKHPSQVVCRDSPRDHETYYAAIKSHESRSRCNELVGIGKFQPMVTKCGHVFHKGCLKSLVAGSHGASTSGLKPECPICAKPISYSQCFNVYFDAVPNAERQKGETQFQEVDQLELENARLRDRITEMQSEAEAQYKQLVDTRARVRFTGEEIGKRDEELSMFSEYIQSVGGLQNIRDKLNTVNQRFQALGMQNTHLAALIEEHAKAQARLENGQRNESQKSSKTNVSSGFQRGVPSSQLWLEKERSRAAQNERQRRGLKVSESEEDVFKNEPKTSRNRPDPQSYPEPTKNTNIFRKIWKEQPKGKLHRRVRRREQEIS